MAKLFKMFVKVLDVGGAFTTITVSAFGANSERDRSSCFSVAVTPVVGITIECNDVSQAQNKGRSWFHRTTSGYYLVGKPAVDLKELLISLR